MTEETTNSPRSFNHRIFMFIVGCLILSQLRSISNYYVNNVVKFDSTSMENEKKLRYIDNEKRKFEVEKGLLQTREGDGTKKKIPYLDDDDELLQDRRPSTSDRDQGLPPPKLRAKTPPATTIPNDINAFCGKCTWNNTNIACNTRAEFIMKRYPLDNPTINTTIQLIMKTGHCIDPNWVPKFVDEEIEQVENEAASILKQYDDAGSGGSDEAIVEGTKNTTTAATATAVSPKLTASVLNRSNNITSSKVEQPIPTIQTNHNNTTTASIDLVSLTTKKDFFILFNESAITSWLKHIQNIRSITFIGPASDFSLFQENMMLHYPHLVNNKNNNSISTSSMPPIRWVHETHWQTTYKQKYGRCPYPSVCQQLIKLFVFDLRTHLDIDIRNNVLILDSDTVWSRDVTFINPIDGKVTYFEVHEKISSRSASCDGMDPINFTETITMGRPQPISMMHYNHSTGTRTEQTMIPLKTVTPYTACQRPEYPNATGARHIAHHMIFQYDVMMHLHSTIMKAWKLPNIWHAFVKCFRNVDCKGRISEYELYYSFISYNYPERVHVETLVNGENIMIASAVCNASEMECCHSQGVLLKGCHDHRIDAVQKAKNEKERVWATGDMCCKEDEPRRGSRCSFCNGENAILNLDLVVPNAGGKTCGSIKSLTESEVYSDAICATIQQEEKVCCPDDDNQPTP